MLSFTTSLSSLFIIIGVACSYRITRFFAGNLFLHYSRVMWKPQKLLNNYCRCYLLMWLLACSYEIMSLYRYFKPMWKVPDPNGLLSSVVPPSAIHQANLEVMNIIDTFVPSVHIVYVLYLKHMLVSPATHAPANRALNNTSTGMVSFFVDHIAIYMRIFLLWK